MDSTNSSSNPESWIVLNHDYSWEEVVLNGMDGWFIDDDIPQLAALPAAARPFDAARLSDVCRGFRSSLERMDSHLQAIVKELKEYDDPRLARCHQPVHETLHRLCSSSLRLFLAGSEGPMKRKLVKEMLGLEPDACPYSDRVTVWYHSSSGGPLIVLIHFRQDVGEEEAAGWGRGGGAVEEHLASHGPAFPLRASDMAHLEQMLGCHGVRHGGLDVADAGWEDVSTCLHLVDSLEAFIAGSEVLDAGLEVIDGSTADMVSNALRRQADVMLFVNDVDADPEFDWWPVQQALQYFERESVFVVAVGSGREDAPNLLAARARAIELGVPRSGAHVIAGGASSKAAAERLLAGLEAALAAYLEGRAAARALRLSRQVSRLVEMLHQKADNTKALLSLPQAEARALRTAWTPKLLALQDKHELALREVRLEYARHKDRIQREAESFFRRQADELPAAAARFRLPAALAAGAGAFRGAAREDYARQAEMAVARWLEEETDRWTAMHLLPSCERAEAAVDQALGDQAWEHGRDAEDLRAAVSSRARQGAAQPAPPRRLPPAAAGLPALGARLAAYFGAANGCRTLLPAAATAAGGAAMAYGLLAVGAVGGGLGSWLAFRSAGAEAETQIRRCVAEDRAAELRRRAAEVAGGIASAYMQPCLGRIDAYEAFFRGELCQFAGAMEDAAALLEGGAPRVVPRLRACERFRQRLVEIQATLRSEQFELFRFRKS